MTDIRARLADALFPYLLYPAEAQAAVDVLLSLPEFQGLHQERRVFVLWSREPKSVGLDANAGETQRDETRWVTEWVERQ